MLLSILTVQMGKKKNFSEKSSLEFYIYVFIYNKICNEIYRVPNMHTTSCIYINMQIPLI